MKIFKTYPNLILILIILLANSCVEAFDISTIDFEDALVVEATITNENKHQEIKLTRTFRFEEDNSPVETNAVVSIIDDLQNIYAFEETSPGKYVSILEFAALANRDYQLSITTNDGKAYQSLPVQLPSTAEIEKLSVAKKIDNEGLENMSIYVDSFDPSGNSKYYRYEYEETYKIIAPKWSLYDLVLVKDSSGNYSLIREIKTEEQRECYNTVSSTAIIQTETSNLFENRVSQFPVRVISRNNAIISHRYSILVTQFVQSLEAYTYYKTLNKLSSSESLLSQRQPGFFNGNINSIDNLNEKVVGFFDVSTVSSKRIYFNFQKYFPNESLPPYFEDCELFAPDNSRLPGELSTLMIFIKRGEVKYYKRNTDPQEGPYDVVRAPCGDCTKLGTNIKPDFWVD